MTGGVIFAILVVVYQIVTLVLRNSAKEKERQARQQQQGARERAGRAQARVQGRTTTPGSAPPPGGSKPADLAARRQAQLEMLRKRRQSRQGGQPIASVPQPGSTKRVRPPAPVKPPPPSRTAPGLTTSVVPGRTSAGRTPAPSGPIVSTGRMAKPPPDRTAKRPPRQKPKLKQAPTDPTSHPGERHFGERPIDRHAGERHAEERFGEAAIRARAALASKPAAPQTRDTLTRLLKDRASLKAAFLLKEVLDKPLGLR